MRIVVSGTHASGKSTLIADFVHRHPEFTVWGDPFELIDESWDAPAASMFAAQLRVAADRLTSEDLPVHLIVERAPIDFYAYLLALDEGDGSFRDLLRRAEGLAIDALRDVDLLVVLPLDPSIRVEDDESPHLRTAMNDALLELIDDPDLIGGTRVLEVTGSREQRLLTLEDSCADLGRA